MGLNPQVSRGYLESLLPSILISSVIMPLRARWIVPALQRDVCRVSVSTTSLTSHLLPTLVLIPDAAGIRNLRQPAESNRAENQHRHLNGWANTELADRGMPRGLPARMNEHTPNNRNEQAPICALAACTFEMDTPRYLPHVKQSCYGLK